MLRYKLIIKRFITGQVESNVEKIEAIENEGIIDMMHHQFSRYKSVTHFTRPLQVWQSWLMR